MRRLPRHVVSLVTPAIRAQVACLPVAPGVYRFRDARGQPLYIGRATDLRHRVASYWSDLGDRGHLRRMVGRVVRIEATLCASTHEAAWLERNLLETSMGRWNRTPGGQEVPVYVRLDRRPRTPGVSVVHLPEAVPGTTLFGPYLGGTRVRLATAALHRMLPVAYTADGMSGGDRAMARRHGVTPADRGWLLDAIAAILGHHPDAVQRADDALAAARDRASDAVAFELAARIDAELDALEWVTAAQRVMDPRAEDADIHGWSDGLLTRFELRNGRICRWTQRSLGAAAASVLVAATPPGWQAFARQNADLGAALAKAAAETTAAA